MPLFRYKAVGPDGEVIEGELEASNREAVVDRLHRDGHVPIRADETRRPARGRIALPRLYRPRGVTAKDVVMVTRELATLLQAGLPLDRALTILALLSQEGPVRAMIERLREMVRGGSTLADALSAYPETFPNYYVGMVRAGEAGGTLDSVLVRLADSLDRAHALRESVRSALTYPALVVVMAVVSLAVLLTLVVPEFRALFEESGAALPLPTQILIVSSDFLQDYWWACLMAVLGGLLGLRRHNATERGRMRWDRWVIGVPLFGELIRKVEVARFSRTLGTLLANGVSALPALNMTTGTLGNRAISEAVGRAQYRLAKGEGLADPLDDSGVFPALALQLIRVGEETGQLEAMLLRIADIYDDEVKRGIQRMLSLLVPLVTIALGILIAGIMYSLLAAMLGSYDLTL